MLTPRGPVRLRRFLQQHRVPASLLAQHFGKSRAWASQKLSGQRRWYFDEAAAVLPFLRLFDPAADYSLFEREDEESEEPAA